MSELKFTAESLQGHTKAELVEIAEQYGSVEGLNKAQIIEFILSHQEAPENEAPENEAPENEAPENEAPENEEKEQVEVAAPITGAASVIAAELAKRASRHRAGISYSNPTEDTSSNIALRSELAKRAARYGQGQSEAPENISLAIKQELARRSMKVK